MIDQKNNTLVLLIDLCTSVYPDNIITNLKGEILFLGEKFLTCSKSKKSTLFSDYFLSDKRKMLMIFKNLLKIKLLLFQQEMSKKIDIFLQQLKRIPKMA